MIKKLILLILAISLVGCSARKPIVRTTKPVYRKHVPAKKPVVVSKPTNQNPNTNSNTNSNNNPPTEILEATTRVKVTTVIVQDYIAQFKNIAEANMAQYGIPASIILGQGILESGAGTGPLSKLANNHFGIKCHKEWTGASVKYDDDAAQECFRKYNQPDESYADHALFLTGRSWYASLFKLDKADYKAWARGLKAAGYATDPKYPEKLIAIIERYQLNKYDAEVLGTDFIAATTSNSNAVASTNAPIVLNSELYQVTPGDTLYSISKKFNITVDDLKRKNEIQDNVISIGQNLKIK